MLRMLAQRSLKEGGQGLVEYALILVLVAMLVMVALTLLGEGMRDSLYNVIIANL